MDLTQLSQYLRDSNWQIWITIAVLYVSIRHFVSAFFFKGKKEQITIPERHVKFDQESDEDESKSEESDSDIEDIAPILPEDLEHIPLVYEKTTSEISLKKSKEFYEKMADRRSIRHFSNEPVSADVIFNIIRTAGTSPSGAHTEPWSFVVIKEPSLKANIREIIEDEEKLNYQRRMNKQWKADLKPLKTTWKKPYLTDAPYLILVFKTAYSVEGGRKKTHYYNEISTSIAIGILLTAIHNAGLFTLTSTPMNCGPKIKWTLGRPATEKLVVLLPVGYPAKNCLVPKLERKPLEQIMTEY